MKKSSSSDPPSSPSTSQNKKNKSSPLTPKELEILRLVWRGHTSREIGDRLGKSNRTVELQRLTIKRKLGARTHSHLYRLALEQGLIKPYKTTNYNKEAFNV